MAEHEARKLHHTLQTLATLIDEKPESLASGSQVVRDAALDATQFIFDLCMSPTFLREF